MADHVGEQFGNYQLLRLLGSGGFADVYLGEHIYLKNQAAIKVLQTQMKPNEFQDFLREAQTIAALKHPRIVRVLDFGMQGTLPFLVMDYAPLGTLRDRHPRGSVLPTTTMLPYVKQVAEALQYAHDHQRVHRDVKPENILVETMADLLLSDFGIAIIAHKTQTEQVPESTVASLSLPQVAPKPTKTRVGERAPSRDPMGETRQEEKSARCSFGGVIDLAPDAFTQAGVSKVECPDCGAMRTVRVQRNMVTFPSHLKRRTGTPRAGERWIRRATVWELSEKRE